MGSLRGNELGEEAIEAIREAGKGIDGLWV
jgi:hypothetical protein